MSQEIKTIKLNMGFKLGTVNCYLIKTDTSYILIDTGPSNKRAELEKELENASCMPGNLALIVLTHGDFDHTGNAAYLREKFGTKIAMHYDDLGMAEHGDMFWNRKGNFFIKRIVPVLFKFGKSERFKPDLFIEEGNNFFEYGFDAEVIYLSGHSKGSIGIITAEDDLFCGDLFENTDKPNLNSIMDDKESANVSIGKLMKLNIKKIYPGHGKPFMMESFIKNYRNKVN